jgi:hypothetical protein
MSTRSHHPKPEVNLDETQQTGRGPRVKPFVNVTFACIIAPSPMLPGGEGVRGAGWV